MNEQAFAPGDIIELGGETYQVLNNRGETGDVIPFPADHVATLTLRWSAESACRVIGHAPLQSAPGCATGQGCHNSAQNADSHPPRQEADIFYRG